MTILVSAFGLLGRFAGDLLTSALGWAGSLLFGRVQRSRQVLLLLMMALSFLWLLVILGLLVPGVVAFSTARRHIRHRCAFPGSGRPSSWAWLPSRRWWAWLAFRCRERRSGREVQPPSRKSSAATCLAPVIAGLLIFLAGVGLARKARSARHGWAELHVPIVAKPDGYDQLVDDLHDAVAAVDLPTSAELAPRVLTMPALVLTAVAGANVRSLRPDRIVELVGPDLRIGIYPSDIAISGTTERRVRARAAVLSRLSTTAAHLTTSAEAQAVEDRLQKVAEAQAGAGGSGGLRRAAGAFREVDATLLDLQVPPDEWDILYRLRLQMERDLLAGDTPGTSLPGKPADAAETAGPVVEKRPPRAETLQRPLTTVGGPS